MKLSFVVFCSHDACFFMNLNSQERIWDTLELNRNAKKSISGNSSLKIFITILNCWLLLIGVNNNNNTHILKETYLVFNWSVIHFQRTRANFLIILCVTTGLLVLSVSLRCFITPKTILSRWYSQLLQCLPPPSLGNVSIERQILDLSGLYSGKPPRSWLRTC